MKKTRTKLTLILSQISHLTYHMSRTRALGLPLISPYPRMWNQHFLNPIFYRPHSTFDDARFICLAACGYNFFAETEFRFSSGDLYAVHIFASLHDVNWNPIERFEQTFIKLSVTYILSRGAGCSRSPNATCGGDSIASEFDHDEENSYWLGYWNRALIARVILSLKSMAGKRRSFPIQR